MLIGQEDQQHKGNEDTPGGGMMSFGDVLSGIMTTSLFDKHKNGVLGLIVFPPRGLETPSPRLVGSKRFYGKSAPGSFGERDAETIS